MAELDAVRELRPDHPLPDPARLQPARTALLEAIAAADLTENSPHQAPDRTNNHPGRRRLLVSGLAVAAAVAGTVVLAPWNGSGGHPASAAADPIRVLDQAAQYAASQPFTPPRPNQFVFHAPDTWFSVDGTHDGRSGYGPNAELLPGCRNGRRVIVGANNPANNGKTEPCEPDPGYLSDAPSTVPAMMAYIRQRSGGGQTSPNGLGKQIADMFAHWLSPAAKAALFQAAKQLPGLRVVMDVAGPAGVHGIGITWDGGGGTATMVFDKASHRYLGMQTTGEKGEPGGAPAQSMAIVDRVGQLPH